MWTRAELKDRAKGSLKGNYWEAFVISLVIVVTGGSHNGGGGGSGGGAGGAGGALEYGHFNFNLILLIGLAVFSFILLRIFLGYILEVGGRKFFINLTAGEAEFDNLVYGFRNGRYFKIFVPMLLRSVYLLLWTLLLIIPGIIKSYAYRMVPYILADNPDIGSQRAIELSNEMTRGEKWNIFILDLSFIGWFILGALLLGVGVLFVQPYYDSTQGELYVKLRQNALDHDITTSDELKI